MNQGDEKLLNTGQAMKRLGMSRGTFFARVREKGIKPANYRPNLKKQHNPVWREGDLREIGVLLDTESSETETDEPHVA